MPSVAQKIAVLSQKGGTGKTTAVRHLTDVFRRTGLRVLAVDLDPQGNLSDYFDVDPEVEPTIGDVLTGRASAKAAVHGDIIPANLSLAEAELTLAGKMGRELTLRKALKQVEGDYDVVFVDCPPSLGLLTVNALVAADFALLSAEAQYFAMQGVEQALEVIELARDSLNPDLEWLGVVFNIADMRTVHSREAFDSLREARRRQAAHHDGPPVDRLRRVGRASGLDPRPPPGSRRRTTWRWPTSCWAAWASRVRGASSRRSRRRAPTAVRGRRRSRAHPPRAGLQELGTRRRRRTSWRSAAGRSTLV